jgi:hypothetical protein
VCASWGTGTGPLDFFLNSFYITFVPETPPVIVSQTNKKGHIVRPYITNKNKKVNKDDSQGRWELWIYSHAVIVGNERKFRYRQLRFSGFPARFKKREDATEYGRSLLGL